MADFASPSGTGGAAPAATGDPGSSPSPTPDSGQSSHIDVSDDSLVRLPGMKEPVKYGDYYRGLQGQLTKASQKAAALERERATYQQQLQERDTALQRYQQQSSQGQSSRQQQAAQVLDQLRAMPYLDGNAAAEVIAPILQQFQHVQGALQQRDQAIMALYKRLQQQAQIVNGLHGRTSSSDFDAKISKWVGDSGYGPEFNDLAKEMYLAYMPGDDLDAEFPRMFQQRVEQIQGAIRAGDKRRAESARGMNLPGRGGTASPGKPLRSFKTAGAREIADGVWESMVKGTGT